MAAPSRRTTLLLTVVLVCFALHVGYLLVVKNGDGLPLWFLPLIIEIIFLVFCLERYRQAIHLRRQWLLLSIYLFPLVFVYLAGSLDLVSGGLLSRWGIWNQSYQSLTAFSANIPFLLLFSLPTDKYYPRRFFFIDSVQVAVVGYLTYVKLFAVIPFTSISTLPHTDAAMDAFYEKLSVFYASVMVVLSIVATLRLLASPSKDEARFYRVQCLSIYTTATIHVLGISHLPHGDAWIPSIYPLPYALSCFLIARLPPETGEIVLRNHNRLLAQILNFFSPAFFSVALLALALDASRRYFYFGAGAAMVTLLLYCLRAAMLQSGYEQSQQELQESRDILEELSLIDSLTGVANRRRFDRALILEWNRMSREQHPLSLLLIDIDYFKNLNDSKGHAHGDECLIKVASALASVMVRSSDLLARYGGEEFAVILPGVDQSGAQAVAARLRDAVNDLKIPHLTPIGDYISISIGIATHVDPGSGSSLVLLEASDRALYQAKQKGRNRIEVAAAPVL